MGGPLARVFSALAKSYGNLPESALAALSPTPMYLPKSEESASSTLLVH